MAEEKGRRRKRPGADFKARVALEALLEGDCVFGNWETVSGLS
jgi:hypothetical protein